MGGGSTRHSGGRARHTNGELVTLGQTYVFEGVTELTHASIEPGPVS